ncbi:hypothetical protein EJ04DRAFT_138498 [Polyplosphaeria fusca]|uniref:Uncharacterized protein n=1 Tax=Polyplosphaeria fusca TaxID=682080 RepID=A0A9P4R4K9_9PLEO|nr:hypothetical protein EJ04DRAFT_138498 [Polyplosphaeria fusca]
MTSSLGVRWSEGRGCNRIEIRFHAWNMHSNDTICTSQLRTHCRQSNNPQHARLPETPIANIPSLNMLPTRYVHTTAQCSLPVRLSLPSPSLFRHHWTAAQPRAGDVHEEGLEAGRSCTVRGTGLDPDPRQRVRSRHGRYLLRIPRLGSAGTGEGVLCCCVPRIVQMEKLGAGRGG